MADKKLQPIIIKRVKKAAHVHHGGAWKIAYADFVTAMMAFFLLMWLLGSTAQGELQGIAAYFNSPLTVATTYPRFTARCAARKRMTTPTVAPARPWGALMSPSGTLSACMRSRPRWKR